MKSVNLNVEERVNTESDRKSSIDVSTDKFVKVIELNPTVHHVSNKENQDVA